MREGANTDTMIAAKPNIMVTNASTEIIKPHSVKSIYEELPNQLWVRRFVDFNLYRSKDGQEADQQTHGRSDCKAIHQNLIAISGRYVDTHSS